MNTRTQFLLALALPFFLTLPVQSASFKKNERIALAGNSLAERQSLFGHLETVLHLRFPDQELVIRNFGWPADEVGLQQRPNDYTKIDDPLQVFEPDTLVCFFGFNESFGGASKIENFKADYHRYLDQMAAKYGRNGKLRFLLVSPIAFEPTGDRLQPSGKSENENLRLYSLAVREVAARRELEFVDLFSGTLKAFEEKPGAQYTVHGIHLNEEGDRLLAELFDREWLGNKKRIRWDAKAEKIRATVVDKSWIHSQDYRMLNGWYVYGTRRAPYDTETFPEEYKKIRKMVAVRDQYVWNLAQGKPVPAVPDDSQTGELKVPKTAFGTKTYSEPKELRYLTPEESVKAMETAPGFEVSLFASEQEFPELAKPVQLNFDNKGRLWVACMPTYPQWKPGDPRPSDRLLIFEDTNQDGRADKVKVFYDKLHCPTGFEFWNGGVLVVSQPRILFLKDTNGDDKADQVIEWTDGWASDDTHHTVGAWEWSHGGLLHMLEGVWMSTTVETPWGPFRNHNSPGTYVLDPHTLKLRHFITPGYGNGWCYTFTPWGQGIVGDGTTAQHHWDSPLSGSQKGSRQGLKPIFNNQGMRPALGSEFLVSRHFPDEVQGQFLYACVINMNGIPRFEVRDEEAGFAGRRLPDLLKSSDRNFRPGDPQVGPDGALWFIDWHNPLIGHMQYSQRDPNRDHTRGRVFRLSAKDRPLLKPVTQHGKSPAELLEQLREPEPRTRYRVRRELESRPSRAVLSALTKWVSKLDPQDPEYDRLLCEALWVQQRHHSVDRDLLEKTLKAGSSDARAAATRVLADEWEKIPNGMGLLKARVSDEHPRVRLEAVRALSFIPTREAVELTLEAAKHPVDYYLDYTLQHSLVALQPVWKNFHEKGELAANNAPGLEYLQAIALGRPELAQARQQFRRLANLSEKPADWSDNFRVIAAVQGKPQNGREVFERACVACHKAGDKGVDFGPNLSGIGTRLKKADLIESILYPNEKVDPQWLTVNITTKTGEEFSGVIAAEDKEKVVLKIGADQTEVIHHSQIAKRETLKVSNMPEGLGQSLSPEEFVDLVEFLSQLK